jgi:hypothetical protein
MGKRISESKRAEKFTVAFEISDTGREVLADLAAFCHADTPTYALGDTHQTAYNEGKRAVFLYIQNHMKVKEVTNE